MDKNLHDIRQHYSLKTLDEADLNSDPMTQFRIWFDDSLTANILEPNAMTLSTSVESRVHSRVVLLKEIDEEGFVFYTNYNSAKGIEMEHNAFVAANFLWKEIQRQVRIEGKINKISEQRSVAYAQSRPRGSQIGAWVSDQSQVIESRQALEKKQAEIEALYKDQDTIPKPPHWGGYIIKPTMIEFWQGRPSRIHDRMRYQLDHKNKWIIERLAP